MSDKMLDKIFKVTSDMSEDFGQRAHATGLVAKGRVLLFSLAK